MLKGNSYAADKAKELGILDAVVDGDVVEPRFAMRDARSSRPRSEAPRFGAQGVSSAKASRRKRAPFVVSQAHKMVPPEDNGGFAAHKLIDAVEAAVEMPFEFGIAREARLFEELVRSKPSAALRHVFFAERELAKIPGLPAAEPLEIKKAGVIGAGTMGSGIAITFAQAGIPVHRRRLERRSGR